MKSAYVFKFLFVTGLGALFAMLIHADEEKWHRLGREAFLAFQSGKFDQSMASPAPAAIIIIIGVIFAAGLAACYEFSGYLGEKLLAGSQSKREPPTPTV